MRTLCGCESAEEGGNDEHQANHLVSWKEARIADGAHSVALVPDEPLGEARPRRRGSSVRSVPDTLLHYPPKR